MAAAVIDCIGATVRVAGPTISPTEWPTPTPVAGVIARPTLVPPDQYTPPPDTATPIVGGGSPEAATKTAEAAKNTTKTPEAGKKTPQTKTPPSSSGEETDGGGTDWLWPTVIGIVVAVVVVGILSLAFYLWRRGRAR
jgi:hypothetical protein